MMRRLVFCFLVVFCASQTLSADVRTDQRVKFQFAGALGKIVNFFGGKGAREGITTVVAVKGDRKVMLSDETGQIVDLAEEKVYDLDMKKKAYRVMTFAQIKAEMEKARKRAEEIAAETLAREAAPGWVDGAAYKTSVKVGNEQVEVGITRVGSLSEER